MGRVKALSRLAGGNPHGCNMGNILIDKEAVADSSGFVFWKIYKE